MRNSMLVLSVSFTLPMAVDAAAASTPIVAKAIRTDSSYGFMALAMDPTTGKYYSKDGYGFDAPVVKVYDNALTFAKGHASGTVTLQGDTVAGTYMAASDGKLFARTFTPTGQYDWPEGTSVGRWNLADGSLEAVNPALPDMGGRNGYDGFDWGGFSDLNWLQDQTGKYVIGSDGAGTWFVHKMNDDLSIAATKSFSAGSLGYAFARNGTIFLGDSYGSPHISATFDFASGTLSAADYQIEGAGLDYPYLSTSMYDSKNDLLYFFNTNNNTIYRVGALTGFGAVPEPASWAMLIAGFGLAGAAMRRRRALLAA